MRRPPCGRAGLPDVAPQVMPRATGPGYRVGVVGYGLAGDIFHAPLIVATPGLTLAAVVTGNSQRQARAARDHPDVFVAQTAAQLWERSSELDLVVIASPNVAHVPLALEALAHGLHVVVDKPFAPSAADGARLSAEARARSLMVAPFHNRRWDGDFLTVQRLLREGVLGEVLRFESRFERWRAAPKPRWCEATAPLDAEGIVFDLGTHLVDQALELFGPVRSVQAEIDRRHPDVTVADDAFMALEHVGGVRSHLYMSAFVAQPHTRMGVFGRLGSYVKSGMDVQESALRSGQPPGGPGWGEESPDQYGELRVGDARRAIRTEAGAYQRFYAALVESLRGNMRPPVSPDDAVAGLRVIEAAYRAAAEGRSVQVA